MSLFDWVDLKQLALRISLLDSLLPSLSSRGWHPEAKCQSYKMLCAWVLVLGGTDVVQAWGRAVLLATLHAHSYTHEVQAMVLQQGDQRSPATVGQALAHYSAFGCFSGWWQEQQCFHSIHSFPFDSLTYWKSSWWHLCCLFPCYCSKWSMFFLP